MSNETLLLKRVHSGELEIDSHGFVWRVKTRHGRGVKVGGGYLKGTRISPVIRRRAEFRQSSGYLQVPMTRDGRKRPAMAHRLVWVNSNGPIPEGLTINHKNGVKADNRLSNLELMTQSEQRRHALEVLNVNRNRPQGSKHPKTHLVEADVLEIRRRRASGEMAKAIAQDFDLDPRVVSQICTRRTWRHI